MGTLLKRYYYIEKIGETYSLLYKDEEKDKGYKGEMDIEKILSISYQKDKSEFKIIHPDKNLELFSKNA